MDTLLLHRLLCVLDILDQMIDLRPWSSNQGINQTTTMFWPLLCPETILFCCQPLTWSSLKHHACLDYCHWSCLCVYIYHLLMPDTLYSSVSMGGSQVEVHFKADSKYWFSILTLKFHMLSLLDYTFDFKVLTRW